LPALEVHALDFSGHGAAAMRGDAFRIAAFVDDVRELLDARGVERAAFFGYSMGGYVALALAAREPQRVERVMTLGTKFRWTPEYAERESRML
ncbi:alpha/beta hydrolase, partial [Klebsiella pneumoniae]|uniref:alpha/beta fold hydrolase n=1 Tax=Klebsiella pneumoniae TaxID=573 RepID=UPI0021F702A2